MRLADVRGEKSGKGAWNKCLVDEVASANPIWTSIVDRSYRLRAYRRRNQSPTANNRFRHSRAAPGGSGRTTTTSPRSVHLVRRAIGLRSNRIERIIVVALRSPLISSAKAIGIDTNLVVVHALETVSQVLHHRHLVSHLPPGSRRPSTGFPKCSPAGCRPAGQSMDLPVGWYCRCMHPMR